MECDRRKCLFDIQVGINCWIKMDQDIYQTPPKYWLINWRLSKSNIHLNLACEHRIPNESVHQELLSLKADFDWLLRICIIRPCPLSKSYLLCAVSWRAFLNNYSAKSLVQDGFFQNLYRIWKSQNYPSLEIQFHHVYWGERNKHHQIADCKRCFLSGWNQLGCWLPDISHAKRWLLLW